MKARIALVLSLALLCPSLASVTIGQTTTAGVASASFTEGHWTANDAMPPVFTCLCGLGGNDCICSLVAYCGSCKPDGKPNTFSVRVTSQEVLGSRLRMTFTNPSGTATGGGIPLNIKHTDFTQKEDVNLDAAAAAELGFEHITILRGNYSIKNNALVVDIRKGKALTKPK